MPAASEPDDADQEHDDPAGTVEGLRAALAGLDPVDDRESASRLRILDALDTLAAPFDAGSSETHVTASAIIIGPAGVVLHRHRRLHRWMQPGGHIDAGETPASAALRESSEETGLTLHHPAGGPRLIHVDVHPAADDHVHLDLRYLLLSPGGDPAPAPGESPDVGWFSWEQAASLADDALIGGLESARRQPETTGRSDATAPGGEEGPQAGTGGAAGTRRATGAGGGAGGGEEEPGG